MSSHFGFYSVYKWFLLHWTETQFFIILSANFVHTAFSVFFMRLASTHKQSFSSPGSFYGSSRQAVRSSVTPRHTGWACELVWGLSGTLPLPLTGVSSLSFIDRICAALLPPSCNSPKAFKLYTLGSVFVYCCKKISCLSQCWVNNTAPLAHTQAQHHPNRFVWFSLLV